MDQCIVYQFTIRSSGILTEETQQCPVAMVRQFTKAGEIANWYKIESVNERARRYRPYVKKLVGKEFGSTPQLEMAVRCAAFEYEARQLLKKEVLDVLQVVR